ncbi:DUF7779 domain-containing protein [Scytonema sp. NUACC21]
MGCNLSQLVGKPLDFVKVVAEAGRFSLIYRNATNKTFDIHRLVQFVLKAEMDEDICRSDSLRVPFGLNTLKINGKVMLA